MSTALKVNSYDLLITLARDYEKIRSTEVCNRRYGSPIWSGESSRHGSLVQTGFNLIP